MTESASPATGGSAASARPSRAAASTRPRRTGAAGRGKAAAPATGARPLSRIKNRRKAGPLYKVAMVVFTIGLVAICVDAVLFVSGSRDIAWWIHLVTVLAPVGLGLGLVGTVLEARKETDRPG